MFATTRQILREAGPGVGASKRSVGAIAIAVLNRGLRPFLSKWHPLLQAWEALRAPDVNPVEYERSWEKEEQLRHELELLRQASRNSKITQIFNFDNIKSSAP